VLVCIGATYKDLWIHTNVCWRFLREIKELIRLKRKIKNDPRPGGHTEPAQVGVLHHNFTYKDSYHIVSRSVVMTSTFITIIPLAIS
jgi:hypothetical protein